MQKGLKPISESKVNPGYQNQNIKQQAGTSAEVLDTADRNAQTIKNGSSVRTTRTDDISKTTTKSGNPIGGVNDQLFDQVDIDSSGNIIEGSATQMKFVGKNGKECFNKLNSPKFKKYLDANAKLSVPSDFYDDVKKAADDELQNLGKQLDRAKSSGNTKLQKELENKIDDVKKIKQNLKKSTLTNDEAIQARTNPELTTAKRMLSNANEAGIDGAKYGAAIGGGISFLTNLYAIMHDSKKLDQALKDILKDTSKAAALGYISASGGSLIKGFMQNSSSSTIRSLSKTNLPGVVVTSVIDTCKAIVSYANGEIDGVQCLERLGQSGANQVSSAMFATLGQIAIPIPVVGAMAGAMIGCALSQMSYGILKDSLKNAQIARQQRIQIEAKCEKIIEMHRQYQAQIREITQQYLAEYRQIFDNAIKDIALGLQIDDVDLFIKGADSILESLGKESQFSNMDEFERFMQSDEPLRL